MRPKGHLTWPLNPQKKTKQNQKTKEKTKKRVLGQVRWPFGPPHLTLEPSKKNKTKQPPPKKNKRKKKHKKYQRKTFSVISQIFPFLVGVQFFWHLGPKKCAPQKHYKQRGFSTDVWKQMCLTKRPCLGQKHPKPEIPVTIFFVFSSLSTPKNTKMC